jgi:hypothetical protein
MTSIRPKEYVHGGSDGEKILFDKFEASTKCDNWIVLHSLEILHNVERSQSEADFVVLAPGLGLLVIEVKATTSVKYESGWILGGEKLKRGPVVQAKNGMFAISNYLRDRKMSLIDVPTLYCVWFTHSELSPRPHSIEWQDWMLLESKNLTPEIAATVTNVFREGIKWLEDGGRRFPKELAPEKKLRDIAAILRPNFKVVQTMENRLADLKDWLDNALKAQIELVEMIMGEDYSAHLIEGLAGTGKTHIAVHQAKEAASRGEDVLFLCYNSLLAKSLQAQFEDFPQVTVSTISKYMCDIADLAPPNNPSSTWWSEELPKLALEALVDGPQRHRFDRVIIDEGQDLATDAYLDIVDLSIFGGLKDGKVTVFADFDYQDIYVDGKTGRDLVRSKIANIQTHGKLTVNCRNTKSTGDYVTYLISKPSAYTDYRRKDRGRDPRPIPVVDDTNTSILLQNTLNNLLLNYSAQEIVVLSSSKKQLEIFMNTCKTPNSPLTFQKTDTVRWGTSHEFKGLESPVVIFIEFEDGAESSQASFYVAGTRATAELVTILNKKAIKAIRGDSTNE